MFIDTTGISSAEGGERKPLGTSRDGLTGEKVAGRCRVAWN